MVFSMSSCSGYVMWMTSQRSKNTSDSFSVAAVSSGFMVPMKMKWAGSSIVYAPRVALPSSRTCRSAFWIFSGQRLSSSKKRTPRFALKIFPGVNAWMLVGPNWSALTGSMSPRRSSTVKSGLPWTRMKRCSPFTLVVFAFLDWHSGQRGVFGSQ